MPPERTVEISGVVAHFTFVIESDDDPENALYRHARGIQEGLRDFARKQVREFLGTEFDVLEVQVERGSAHILMAIGTIAGAVFLNFSRYESFIKSLNLLLSQLTNLIRRIFGPGQVRGARPVSVTGTWQPGQAMSAANSALMNSVAPDINRMLLAYPVASHAALLAVLTWLVLRHSSS